MLTALVLGLSLTLTPPPPPSLGDSTRSASLLDYETAKLELRVKSAARMLPVWVPLVAGLGGGAACAGLGAFLLSPLSGIPYGLGLYGAMFGGVILVAAAPAFAIAGIVTAIVFAVKNGGRTERLRLLEQELELKKAELRRAKEGDSAVELNGPAPMTLLTF